MLLVLYKLLDFVVCDLKNGSSANCSLSTSSLTTSPESTPIQRGAKESGVCGIATRAIGSLIGTTHVLVILRFQCRADLILPSILFFTLTEGPKVGYQNPTANPQNVGDDLSKLACEH